MAKFQITSNGKKFEITAPDQDTAMKAFASMTQAAGGSDAPATDHDSGLSLSDLITGKTAPPNAQQRYDAAIKSIIDANPNASPEDIQSLKEHYGPSNLMDLAQSGTTFGLSDELAGAAGGLKALLSGGDFGSSYSRWSELQAAREALGRQKAGMLGDAVEMGSSLATMGPERAGVEALVAGAPKVAAATPSLLKTVATSGATGAGLGTIAGFTSTDGDVSKRAVGALEGGLGGAAVGTALPVAARGASAVVDALMQTGAAKQAAAKLGISPDAAKFIQTQLGVDDSLSPAGLSRIASAGPEGMVADAGPSARNVLDYAIQSSGKAGQIARTEIGARVSRDAAAVENALDRALGSPQGVDTARAGIRSTTAPARDAAYKAAYAQPIDYASEDGRTLEELLQRVPKQAIDRANNLMKIKGEQSPQIMAQIGDNGAVTFQRMPDVRQLDYITRALNEEAQHGIGAGAMGGQTTLGSALGDLSSEIRDTLRLHVPEYGDALAVGQDAILRSKAVQNGYDLLKPSTTREDVAGWAKNMTPAQRTDAAQGIRSKISDAVSNVKRTLTDGDIPAREAIQALRDMSTTANRDKVAAVIGKQKADDLFAELDRATKSFDLRASVSDNSKTFQRQSMDRQVNSVVDSGGIVNTLMKGEPVNAGKRAIQMVTGATPERALQGKDAMMQDVVKALLARGPGALAHAQAIQKMGGKVANADRVRQAIINMGLISGPAAGLAGQQVGAMSQ